MAEDKPVSARKAVIGPVRVGYVNVFRARAREEGKDPEYSVMVIIDKGDAATLRKLTKAIEAARIEHKAKVGTSKRTTLRDGDDPEEADLENNPELEGCMFMNVSSKTRPGIVDQRREKILDETMVYSGCYVNLSLMAFGYNTSGNKGVSFALNHVQFVKDGEPLGGMTRAEDDFGDVDPDEAASSLL